jgi:signal transduction histidine kinase
VNDGDNGSWSPLGNDLPDAVRGNLATVLSNITVGIAVSRGGAIAWSNPALAVLCAVGDPEELRGKSIDALWRDVGGGLPGPTAPQPTEVGVRRSDGEWTRARVRCFRTGALGAKARSGASGVSGAAGRPRTGEEDGAAVSPAALHGADVWLVEDVTRLAQRDTELLRVHRELRAAHQELADLRARLAVESEEREQLLGIVSHELRTPVTVISGYSRLLLSEEVGAINDEQRQFLGECHKSCNRLDEFIGRLLAASHAMRGDEPLDLERGSLEHTIRGVVGFLRPLVEERSLDVDVDIDPEATWAQFDSSRIEQVLTNLLANAIKYAGPGGRVTVATRPVRAGGRSFVEIAVCDDGPGVPAELRERIFEPYVRGPNGRNEGGLGLGLAICKRLVEAHGGAITVADAPGGGSRFAFSVPASESSTPDAPRGG